MGPGVDRDAIERVLETARREGRRHLAETEGTAILAALGIRCPAQRFVPTADAAATLELPLFAGDRAVLKVVSPSIQHKSDVGGVMVVANAREAILGGLAELEDRFRTDDVLGFTVNEFIPYRHDLGHELLLGLRWTDDFGPIVVVGPGGVYTEFLAARLMEGKGTAVVTGALAADDATLADHLRATSILEIVTGGYRGQAAELDVQAIVDVVRKLLALGEAFMPEGIWELEVNPLVIAHDGVVALDALAGLGQTTPAARPPRPIRKLENLLRPESIALFGVSERMNPGRIILQNLLDGGFDPDRIHIVKPGTESIAGCRAYPEVAALPERVDLAVLAIAAPAVPQAITDVVIHEKAEGVIVIPGGLEEKQGTEEIVDRMTRTLHASRATPWEGPVINGGNCLGIRSVPGHYDTLFIPHHKLSPSAGDPAPVALICQSGAHLITNLDRLGGLSVRYAISVGNQSDLTLGDYLTYLKDDSTIETFAVYAEGFVRGDGRRFLEAASEIVASGRTVILYRAGRTQAGAKASASHTASVAGDYVVTRALARQAGVVVADTLGDFSDLTQLFVQLYDRPVRGRRLAAISNAGFECVAMADNLGRFELADFGERTVQGLGEVLTAGRIDAIVDVNNPLDLTPMTGDALYADAIRIVMDDANVDVGIIGCVPLTGALSTLPAGEGHREDLTREGALPERMVALRKETAQPWVAVVDGGPRYDPMARYLGANGIPTFRTCDRALRLFDIFCGECLRR